MAGYQQIFALRVKGSGPASLPPGLANDERASEVRRMKREPQRVTEERVILGRGPINLRLG